MSSELNQDDDKNEDDDVSTSMKELNKVEEDVVDLQKHVEEVRIRNFKSHEFRYVEMSRQH